ncbi:MFS transporter [Planctomycetales bacterium ZRK34]|nr:MFS transporter [Planctomycetales bacterium ZRK34]
MTDIALQRGRVFAYKWELLVLLWIAFFLHQADRQIFNNVAPLIMEDLGLSKVQFGIVATVFTAVYGVMVPIAGYAGDALRRKWVVMGSLLVFSLATLLTGFATGLITLVIFRSVATGGGEAFYYPAANSLIAQFHHKTRAMAMAIHQTALYIGIVASSFAATLGTWFGWRNAFYIFGGFGVLWAIVVLMLMHNTPRPAGNGNTAADKGPSVGEVLAHFFSKPTAMLLSVAFAGMVFVNIGYLTWMPTYLNEHHHLELDTASFLALFCHHVTAFIGVVLGGKLSDRWAMRRKGVRMEFEYLGLLLGAPFIFWMGIAGDPVMCCIALAGFGLFRGVYDSNLFAAPFDVIEPRYRSSAVGLMLSCAFIVGASASTILAWMAERLDMSTAIASMAAVYLFSAVLVFAARHLTYDRDYYDETLEEPEA